MPKCEFSYSLKSLYIFLKKEASFHSLSDAEFLVVLVENKVTVLLHGLDGDESRELDQDQGTRLSPPGIQRPDVT